MWHLIIVVDKEDFRGNRRMIFLPGMGSPEYQLIRSIGVTRGDFGYFLPFYRINHTNMAFAIALEKTHSRVYIYVR